MASSELELSSLMTSSENAKIKMYNTNHIGMYLQQEFLRLFLNKFIGSESKKIDKMLDYLKIQFSQITFTSTGNHS